MLARVLLAVIAVVALAHAVAADSAGAAGSSTSTSTSSSPPSGVVDEVPSVPVGAQGDEQRFLAWCRALEGVRRRTAFDLLRLAGEDALPVVVDTYADSNEIGRHLKLLLLAHSPGEVSMGAALKVLADPSDTSRTHMLARVVLRQQAPRELQRTLRTAVAKARSDGNRFALRQYYRVLGELSVGNAIAVLDGYVPPAGGDEAAGHDGQWASLERELWQTALLRAGVRAPIQAYQALDALQRDHPRAVAPLLTALDAYRHASSDMRHFSDRRHRVRIRAERAVIELCRAHPLMANVLLTHADYRVRRLAVERLADRRTIGAIVFAFEALDDTDRGIANQALEAFTRFGPSAPELLEILSETVPEQTREHLRSLAEEFPSAEELAELRELREKLRNLLVPMIHQRTLHDPATGELYRAWSTVQRHWQRLATTWIRWWHENGDIFRPAPYRQLVHILLAEFQ